MRDFTSELLRREIAHPLHPRPHGRAALVAVGPCAAVDQHPTHGPATQPPAHGPAREVPEPPSARGVRTGLPRWLALTHEDPDIGRGARPARPPAPHAHARLGCRTPRRVPCRGRAAGDVGPYHCPARTHVGPYHCPTRTHLAPTIVPPAPTSAPTIVPPAPTWPLPLSRPHPLGPDVGSTTARCAKHPRRPRRGASSLSRPCVHPTRVPRASRAPRNSPPKNLNFFLSSKDAGGIHSCVGLRADMRRAQ